MCVRTGRIRGERVTREENKEYTQKRRKREREACVKVRSLRDNRINEREN